MAAPSPQQLLDILLACRGKPRFPSQVEVTEFSLFDPKHQQQKHNLFQELLAKGLLQIVRDPKGRRTPLGYSCTPAGLAEISLLQKHPALGKKVADPTSGNRGSF